MSNVALLWDLENVNPGADSLFLEGLIEHAESKGRVVTARAYGNWTNAVFSKLAPSLTRRYFYLVHIPKGRKNSSDMVLVSDTLEILRIHDHIDTFILVTGDSDFRFLVLALQTGRQDGPYRLQHAKCFRGPPRPRRQLCRLQGVDAGRERRRGCRERRPRRRKTKQAPGKERRLARPRRYRPWPSRIGFRSSRRRPT